MDAIQPAQQQYVGFWMRFLAFLIDSVIILLLMSLLLAALPGSVDISRPEAVQVSGPVQWLSSALLAVAVILFWRYRGATPGKMAISARIVDARTGGAPSTARLIGRYFAYFVSTIPLGLGFLWVAFDPRKQGWHDKLSGTVVVYDRKRR